MTTVLESLDNRTIFEQNLASRNTSKIIINKAKTSTPFKFAEKNKSSIKEYIDKYGKIIWRIARIFANTTKDAEKLTCEIFSELWKNAGKVDYEIMDDKKYILMIALKCVNKNLHKVD